MNEESLVNALRRNGPLMRADLTRVCGLSKPTVGLGLANLERDGWSAWPGGAEGCEALRRWSTR